MIIPKATPKNPVSLNNEHNMADIMARINLLQYIFDRELNWETLFELLSSDFLTNTNPHIFSYQTF